ncbi:FtsQ-type POTRA domain-containing protein [Planosporangium flavigriseum]|uniref:Cell division protein FtsQ n=1 Tax=Planosporangium flavigriseum TaxID=373681 RepID=A0A8J3LWP0_9ACTN|nr:FtsQ-type POTRA domain-containing protein [Planosporangium flavigriseum]NJC63207.1 FtsQ-type POTRA domain-containing protein [Planosporangium flavigriseum]GIG72480.1 cell division protein FtsQ [Planosporangium flavigriseum]
MSSRWRLVRARRDAVPDSVRLFSQRARRRRLRAALPWLVALGAVVLLAIIGAVVYTTPLLGVAGIRVTGARLVTADQVRAAARVAPGTPLVRVDVDVVARRVGGLPPVSRVTVSRSWPRTLVIRVVERTPAAVVPMGDRYAIVDGTGTVFDSAPVPPAGLPVLKLRTPGRDDSATRAALTVLAALPPGLREPMAALVADSPARIRLELRDGRQIVWGDATQNDEKARVALTILGNGQKVTDVSAPSVVTTR